MRESRMSGSVQGALRNGRPYRDRYFQEILVSGAIVTEPIFPGAPLEGIRSRGYVYIFEIGYTLCERT